MIVSPSIRLAIVGCGRVTETLHLPSLRQVAGVEVVGVSDISVERLNKLADQFHIKERHSSYHALLENASIDAVAVCVPAHSHVQIALDALKAGKHLFIEKPLALSLEEADLLINSVKNSRLKATVGFNLRAHRLIQQARQILRQGTLGKIQTVRTVLTGYHQDVPEWRERRFSGGGVLFEQAVHHFDLWRYLLQSEVIEVFATSHSERWDDESATVTARFTDGSLASALFSERALARNELEFFGESRFLRVDCYRFDGLEHVSSLRNPGGIQNHLKDIWRTLRGLPSGVSRLRYGGDFVDSYRAEWCHFIDAIRNDTPTQATLEDGRSALQLTLAAVTSLSTGRVVKIPPVIEVMEQALGRASIPTANHNRIAK